MNENCEYYTELMNLSIDGCATPEQTAELEKHILGCRECYERLIDYQIMTKSIEELKTELPKNLHSNIMAAIEKADENNEFKPKRSAWHSVVRYLPYTAAVAAIVLIFLKNANLTVKVTDSLNYTSGVEAEISREGYGLQESYMESKLFSDTAMNDRNVMSVEDGIAYENDANAENNVITADEIAEIYASEYPESKFAFMVIARFDGERQLDNALNSSMFRGLSIDRLDEYGICCVTVKNNNSSFKDIIYELPSEGASAEILSDSRYEWFKADSVYGTIVLFAE